MKTTIILLLVALGAQAQTVPSVEVQIKVALLACPEESRDHAMVYGYSLKGEFIVLRAGTNEMVCIADDPASPGLSVSCYHKSLEPFMERGRVLKRQGKNFQEIFDIREQEAKSGKLILPKQPASLVVLTAATEDYNAANSEEYLFKVGGVHPIRYGRKHGTTRKANHTRHALDHESRHRTGSYHD